MNVEFKLVTYKEPINSDEQEFKLIKRRNYSAYNSTVSNFVYDIKTKIIYDTIYCENYRSSNHETILKSNGFNFLSIEPDNFIRFAFNTTDCYNNKYQFTGNYRYNELGIVGLQYSEFYYDIPLYKQRANELKKYDLDIIESYIEFLKTEQRTIRETEINLNLPKEPDKRKKRKFNITKK